MGCGGSSSGSAWQNIQLTPTGLPDRDSYYDEIQEAINEFDSEWEKPFYAKDKFMYQVDMDILDQSTSQHAIIGLMYLVAGKCGTQGQFEAAFEPKMAHPFLYMSAANLGPELAQMCTYLKEFIEFVIKASDRIRGIEQKFNTWGGEADSKSTEIMKQMEGRNDLGLLNKIRAVKAAEYNARKIKELKARSNTIAGRLNAMKSEIEKAVDLYINRKDDIMDKGKKCMEKQLRSPYECYRDFGARILPTEAESAMYGAWKKGVGHRMKKFGDYKNQ